MKQGQEFIYKGVTFKIIKVGKKAVMLDAKADFYDCESIEVWQLRKRKESIVKGNVIKAGFKRPNDNDYPYSAHQFMEKHFNSFDEMILMAEKRFQEYEDGIRPKKITSVD